MAAAISNEIVRIYAHYQERGPSRAKTYVFDDVVLTVMEESAGTVEQTLAQAGDEEFVEDIRARVQGAIAGELKAAVERLTGRCVRAIMGGSQIDPDVRCDIFLLGPEAASKAG